MAELTEDQLWNMSDEELEAAAREEMADMQSPETEIEEEMVEEEVVEETTDEEVELDEDLEQPVEDSDDDLVMEDDEEADPEEESEEDESEPDEDEEESKELTDEGEEETEEEVTKAQKHKFKANGREYEFTPEEIMEQFPKIFGQAMDYTKKTQAMKPWRKTIDAIEQAELNHDDINLMIDVLKGDKDAIASVMKRTGIDALDLDTENNNYKPKDYGRDDATLAMKDVIDEISADKEFDITQRVLSKDWDENSFNEITKDPELVRLLHVDVKSGMYDKVQPIAEKLKVFDRGRKSDLDYYKQAAGEYFAEQNQIQQQAAMQEQARLDREAKQARQAELQRVKDAEAKQKSAKKQASRRKAAAPTKSNAGMKKSVDFLDDSDEAFEDWYSKLQEQY